MKIGGMVTIVTAFGILIYIGFSLFYPFTILEITEAKVLTPIVKPGDSLIYQVSYCKYADTPAQVTRTFHEISERNVILTEIVSSITKTGCSTVKIPIKISADPKISLPGEYYLQVSVSLQVNSFRTDTVHFRVEGITIK